MRYPNVTSLYFATPLAFKAPTEGSPWDDLRKISHGGDDLRKISHGGQRMAKVQKVKYNIAESFNPLSRAHERYRR